MKLLNPRLFTTSFPARKPLVFCSNPLNFPSLAFCRRIAIIASANFNCCRFLGPCNHYFYRRFCMGAGAKVPATATMGSLPPSVHVNDPIILTDKENQIFDFLLQVCRHFNLNTELRVAGGWVRDKLLGKECYDIDIALENMVGKEFCDKVNEYLSATGEETKGVGLIQSNPDQSKHLETARMHLFDVWIDFVNLRSEEYTNISRIPTMEFGTAQQDAYRRDLTINSMFYNINTNSVEDLTGRGIPDLKSGKIVTPSAPKETFLDDPLRVLRAIRFGARFGFVLDEELKIAAMDDEVKAAIIGKISRERVGHEIDLMISGNRPVDAMSYISELQLFWSVFSLPPEIEPQTLDGCERLCVAYMDASWRFLQLIGCSSITIDQLRLSLYAALLLPLRKTVYRDKKGKQVPIARYIFGTSLKLKSSDAETVCFIVINLHLAVEKFLSLIPLIQSDKNLQILEVEWKKEIIDVPIMAKLRVLAGLLLREIKEFWRSALVLSILLYPTDIGLSGNSSSMVAELTDRRELFNRIENAIMELGLEKVWELKPLVNGKDIMSILQLKSGGPVVKEWQQKQLEWQLAHPSGSSKECIDWMEQSQSKRQRTE
ncbi:tRNA nucleotidyltransferase cca2-like isoform X1 [Primulina huaijiensis]|uniref:tRNA nucleotidyltransferase cca2-like isoform X1 n=1 Tax=Primulina huaijiensis TaxID=1492673 RepID=UPI003CC73A6A